MWETLTFKGPTVLDDNGAFAHLRYRTCAKKRQSYSTWLTFIRLRFPELVAAEAVDRVTPATVGAWLTQLGQLVSPYTRLLRAVDLMTIVNAFAPEADWTWLRRAISRIQHGVAPTARKAGRIRSSAVIVGLGMRLMSAAEITEPDARSGQLPWHAAGYRDGLIIAFLALRPLRLRNLIGLELGRTLLQVGTDDHRIVYGADETKTREPIEVDWPAELESHLRRYLDHYRPRLLGNRVSRMLWIGIFGAPMAEQTIRQAITIRTRQGLGAPISPHLFRDCAATTISIEDPQHIGIASSLLGHSSSTTTDKHYRQASSVTASRQLLTTVALRREELRSTTSPFRTQRARPPRRDLPLFSNPRDPAP
jgi:integrase